MFIRQDSITGPLQGANYCHTLLLYTHRSMHPLSFHGRDRSICKSLIFRIHGLRLFSTMTQEPHKQLIQTRQQVATATATSSSFVSLPEPESSILNKYSRVITQPKSQGASQAMLMATGLKQDDLSRPQVGICSVWFEGNPCNMHLLDLGQRVKKSIQSTHELIGFQFNTIGVSDGISMGTSGMSYSLPSRELIADSIETVVSRSSSNRYMTYTIAIWPTLSEHDAFIFHLFRFF